MVGNRFCCQSHRLVLGTPIMDAHSSPTRPCYVPPQYKYFQSKILTLFWLNRESGHTTHLMVKFETAVPSHAMPKRKKNLG